MKTMNHRVEEQALYLKVVDDALAAQGEQSTTAVLSGLSVRVLLRTDTRLSADGQPLPEGAYPPRRSVALSIYRRMHRMRPSGKAFHFWQPQLLTTVTTTSKGLVVERTIDRAEGRTSSRHLFAEKPPMHSTVARAANAWGPVGLRNQAHGLQADELVAGWLVNAAAPFRNWISPAFEVAPPVAPAQDAPERFRVLEGPAMPEMRTEIHAVLLNTGRRAAAHVGELPSWEERFPVLAARDAAAQAAEEARLEEAQQLRRGGRVSRNAFGQRDLYRIPRAKESTKTAACYMPFLDAPDPAAAAKKLFGIKNYRRPLGREVARLDTGALLWFSMFRGLVPIEWIVEAMSKLPDGGNSQVAVLSAHDQKVVRSVLRRTPQGVLKRILKEDATRSVHVFKDLTRMVLNRQGTLRDLDALDALIEARGQRNLRGSRDLEQLVMAIPADTKWHQPRRQAAINAGMHEGTELHALDRYNRQAEEAGLAELPVATWSDWQDPEFRDRVEQFMAEHERELMTAAQRRRAELAEEQRLERMRRDRGRAAWAKEVSARLEGAAVVLPDGVKPRGGSNQLGVVVATKAEQLSHWGSEMGNCIGGYSHRLGLDVLFAVVDSSGKVRLNVELNQERGVVQLLGKHNRDAIEELGEGAAQAVVDLLGSVGVDASPRAMGMDGLKGPAVLAELVVPDVDPEEGDDATGGADEARVLLRDDLDELAEMF